MKYIPTNENATTKKQTFINITKYLKNKCLKATLEFTVYLSKIFTNEFTLKIQTGAPLIHILYSQISKLIYILYSNVIKSSIIDDTSINLNCEKLIEKSNLKDVKDIGIGEKIKKSIFTLSELD